MNSSFVTGSSSVASVNSLLTYAGRSQTDAHHAFESHAHISTSIQQTMHKEKKTKNICRYFHFIALTIFRFSCELQYMGTTAGIANFASFKLYEFLYYVDDHCMEKKNIYKYLLFCTTEESHTVLEQHKRVNDDKILGLNIAVLTFNTTKSRMTRFLPIGMFW